jgi:ribosomal protein S18 acetylase RimI-like enzyme
VTLGDQLASVYAESLRRWATRSSGRFAEEVAGLSVVSLGLPERWANTVVALAAEPEAAAVVEALGWFAARGLDAQAIVRERDVAALVTLRRVDELPAFVAPAASAQDVLSVVPAQDAAEFARIYAAAFAMRPGMAEALVVDADIGAPGMVHLVGRRDGEAVACALLQPADGLGQVSALGVLPAGQGRGFGTAMLAACGVTARAHGCDRIWLHASASSRGFYESLGFECVDTHVALAG